MILGIIVIYFVIVACAILISECGQFKFVEKEINKETNGEKLGKIGEIEVSSELRTLPSDKYEVIDDLLYLNNNRTHQIDHVVVSNYGIFIIETKNYSGSVYGSDNYNTWSQYLGKKKYPFLNPVLQNRGHVKALENKIPEYKDFFVPIVCFTNKTKLRVRTKYYVINLRDLLHVISTYKTEVLIPDIHEVAQNLRNLSIDLYGAKEHHKNSINKR